MDKPRHSVTASLNTVKQLLQQGVPVHKEVGAAAKTSLTNYLDEII